MLSVRGCRERLLRDMPRWLAATTRLPWSSRRAATIASRSGVASGESKRAGERVVAVSRCPLMNAASSRMDELLCRAEQPRQGP
jgi:hypothetical protein